MNTKRTDTPESRLALQPLDWCAVALLALTLFLVPLTAGHFANSLNGFGIGMDYQIGVPLAWVLPALATVVIILREYRRPVAIGSIFGVREGVLLLTGWALLSVLLSNGKFFCWNAFLTLLAGLLVSTLISRLGRDPKAWLVLLGVLLGVGSLVSVLGIMEYFAQRVPEWRIFGTFANPDFLAGYLLLGIPMALASFVATKDSRARLLFGFAIALQTSALFLTGSRAGILALAGAIIVWVALLAWSGKLRGVLKPLGLALSICLVFGVIGFAPLRNRVIGQASNAVAQPAQSTAQAVQVTAEAQGHSAAFRRWTWQGTIDMIRSRAILGTGFGSYEIAYPKYTLTAFTAHAHNGYLQWTSETGVPGALFLLFALASLAAFALYVLRIAEGTTDGETPKVMTFSVFQEPRVLLAGVLAAVSASLLHSFIDSDWYIVAVLITFPAVLGLLLALSRALAPLATNEPSPASKGEFALGAVVVCFLLWQGFALYSSRLAFVSGSTANGLEVVRSQFQNAVALFPRDPEPTLILASIEQQGGNLPEAERLLVGATQMAPCGKTFYRLAQFYMKTTRLDDALRMFEEARSREPRNVQNLRALGDAYRQAHKLEDAKRVYEIVTELERGVYGKVRAMPEVIEAEFGYSHIGLADVAMEEKAFEEALSAYSAAGTVFGEYWEHRDWEAYRGVLPQKRVDWRTRYQYLLEQIVKVKRQLRRDSAADDAKLQKFLKEAAEAPSPETEMQTGGRQ